MVKGSSLISDGVRYRLTTVAMVLVLAGSLVFAYSISTGGRPTSQSTTIQSGVIRVDVPGSWNVSVIHQPVEGMDGAATYVNQSGDQSLTFSRLRNSRLRAPSIAMATAMDLLLGKDKPNPATPHGASIRITSGPLTGQINVGVSVLPDAVMIHVIAVVTYDGHRYWSVMFQHKTAKTPEFRSQLSAATNMIRTIIQQLHNQTIRKADEDDFKSLGLAGWPSQGSLDAIVQSDEHYQSIVQIVPKERAGQLQIWRVRQIPDADDVELGLTPANLLNSQFRQATGRLPQPSELWSGKILDYPAWRIGHGLPASGLVRQLFYVRTSEGQAGLLMELLCEPGVLTEGTRWLDKLVDIFHSSAVHASALGSISSALDSGTALIQKQVQLLDRVLTPGWDYSVIKSQGLAIGCQATQVIKDSHPSMPYRGRTMILIFSPSRVRLLRVWQTSQDGTQWRSQTLRRIGLNAQPSLTQVELMNGQITVAINTGANTHEATYPAPPTLINPALEDCWPILEGHRSPALVWMTHGVGTAQPYWIEQPSFIPHRASAIQDSSSEILIRPYFYVEADHAYLSKRFQIERHVSKRIIGLFQGATVETSAVERDKLTSLFPALDELLISWEQDESFEDLSNYRQ